MNILYIFLTVVMFLDCVLLVFLVLLQLPKKEAGMGGMAFGGAATDALFGAGSGNVLTKITKYVAGIFFVLAILMAMMVGYKPESSADALAKKLSTGATLAPSAPSAPPATAAATPPPAGGLLQLSNLAPAASTNAGPAPAPAPASADTVKTNK
jgi:preprotein translocase subunit SecG